MTPCEERGWKVGDRFKIIDRFFHCFDVGDEVTLIEDDGTKTVSFAGPDERRQWVPIGSVEKISSAPAEILTRLREAAKAADELPAIISEINALLPDGWEVRRTSVEVSSDLKEAHRRGLVDDETFLKAVKSQSEINKQAQSKPVFKVGQKWKSRDGSITSIKAVTDDEDYPVICNLGRMYSPRGFWMKSEKESDIDLIELIEDAPK